MRLAFGCDHAGFELCERLAADAAASGHKVARFGSTDGTPSDYPDAASEVARSLLSSSAEFGVLVCGTGIGMSIRANRHHGVRAALCCNPAMAVLAREHNHANILCLGGRVIGLEEGVAIMRAFLEAQPDQSERHARRVKKLDASV